MKHTFTSREIAHVWANQTPPFDHYGKSPGAMSFRDSMFFSYATVIARHIAHKGKQAVVIDLTSFSNSTSKHQGRVQAACSHLQRFYVRIGRRGQTLFDTPESLARHYTDECKRLLAFADEVPATKKGGGYKHHERNRWCGYVVQAMRNLQSAQEVAQFFGIKQPKECQWLKTKAEFFTQALAGQIDDEKKRAHAKVLRAQREAKERKTRLIERVNDLLTYDPAGDDAQGFQLSPLGLDHPDMELLPDDLKQRFIKWHEVRNANTERLWRAGSNRARPSNTILRISGDDIETSKGARVPIADGEKAYRLLAKHRHEDYAPLAEIYIGHYRFTKSTPTEIHIGCHAIPWSEVDLIAKQLNW